MSAQEAVADAFVGEGITVKWDASAPHADLVNKVMHLRPLPEEIPGGVVLDVQADCDHELAHFLYTDPEALTTITSDTERVIVNAIEDGRIEREHGSRFLGAKQNLESSNAVHIAALARDSDGSEQSKRQRMLVALMLMAYGDSPDKAVERLGKDIAPMLDQIEDLFSCLRDVSSTADAVSIGKQIAARWNPPVAKRAEGSPAPVDGRKSNQQAKKQAVDGAGLTDSGDGQESADFIDGNPIAERRKRIIASFDFDSCSSVYRARTEDDVVSVVPEPTLFWKSVTVHPSFMEEVRSIAGPLRRKLLMEFRGRGLVESRGHKQGIVDDRSLHRVAMGDRKVFKHLDHDLTVDRDVTILVDCSGSMVDRPGAFENLEARRLTRLWTAAQASCAASLVLDLIGVPNEVLAWTTTGYAEPDPNYERVTPLYHMVVKPSSSSFHAAQRNFTRLALFEQTVDNIDGEALLWAARRLADRTKRSGLRPLLIVFSDGEPCSALEDDATLAAHLQNAVQRVERAGIQTLGIGIQSDNVSHFYPRWAVIQSLSDMTSSFYRLLQNNFRNSQKAW